MKNYLSLLGWNDGTEKEIFTEEELEQAFDLRRVVKSAAVFDMQKLRWMNGQVLVKVVVEQVIHNLHTRACMHACSTRVSTVLLLVVTCFRCCVLYKVACDRQL
jgi:glutamyl/glutaminyl-tRNA synthetase